MKTQKIFWGTAGITYTTQAILLRKIKLSETSLIISWLTEKHGAIKTVARGARNLKSQYAGQLDLFYRAEIHFALSRRGELHQLREVFLQSTCSGLRVSYDHLRLAAYFVELIELVTEREYPVPELFDLLHRALAYLDRGEPTRKVLLHFEAETARLLGIWERKNSSLMPEQALCRTYGRLPQARAALLEAMPEVQATPKARAHKTP